MASLWANEMGIGISSGVSSHAKPNIIPWSPAPMASISSSLIPLFLLPGFVNPHGNIRRLLVNWSQNRTRITVKSVLCSVITYFPDCTSCNFWYINIAICCNLSGYQDQPVVTAVSHATLAIGSCEKLRPERHRDLVAYFIGMALRNRFRRKQFSCHLGYLLIKIFPCDKQHPLLHCRNLSKKLTK